MQVVVPRWIKPMPSCHAHRFAVQHHANPRVACLTPANRPATLTNTNTFDLQGGLRAGGQHDPHLGEGECSSGRKPAAPHVFCVMEALQYHVGRFRAKALYQARCMPPPCMVHVATCCRALGHAGQLQLCGPPAAGAPLAHVGGAMEPVPPGCGQTAARGPRPLLVSQGQGWGGTARHCAAWHGGALCGLAWRGMAWQGMA